MKRVRFTITNKIYAESKDESAPELQEDGIGILKVPFPFPVGLYHKEEAYRGDRRGE